MNKKTEGRRDSDLTADLGGPANLVEDEIRELKRSLLVGFKVPQDLNTRGTTLAEPVDLMEPPRT